MTHPRKGIRIVKRVLRIAAGVCVVILLANLFIGAQDWFSRLRCLATALLLAAYAIYGFK